MAGCVPPKTCRAREDAAYRHGQKAGAIAASAYPCRDKAGRYVKCGELARPKFGVSTSCAVLHTDAEGNVIPCPDAN